MKYTVRTSEIDVVGTIWMPSVTAATTYTLTDSDVDNARDDEGKLTRESVGLWLDSHSGDFAEVADFHASLEDGDETVDIPWAYEDSEYTFGDLMFPEEDY